MLVVVAPDADPARVDGPARRRRRDPRRRRRDASRSHPPALADLGRRGITSLFLEGGRTLAAAFAAAGEIDESRIFVAPVLLGDPASSRGWPGGTEDASTAALPDRPARRARRTEQVGEDTLITARFKEW